MATNLNVRIVNKNDTYDALQSSNFIPLKGEIVLAEVLTTNTDVHGNRYEVPTYLMKVGDNEHKFSELKWLHAPASDVYAWAKATGLVVEVTGEGNAITSAQWTADKLVLTKGETFATKAQLDAAIAALTAEDGAIFELDERVTAIESSLGTGNAKEAIEKAQSDATQALANAATALAAAEAAQGDVDALEGTISTLDATVASNKSAAETAVANEKTARENADAQIRTDFATADETTLSTAKDYTDDEIGKLDTSLKAYADTAETDAVDAAKVYADATFETKSAVATAVQGAKDYADSLADNYDASGSAAQALADAKDYADRKADTAKTEAVASAKSYTDGLVNPLSATVDGIDTRLGTAEGKITTIEGQITTLNAATCFEGAGTLAARPAAGKKAGAIYVATDNNKEYVWDGGEWVELGDTTAELAEITTIKGDISDLDAAYKAADSTLGGRIDAIVGDYLKGSDKAELTGAIATAKQEAITAAATDATTKANTAEANAKADTRAKVEAETAAREGAISGINQTIGTVTTGKTVVQMIADAQAAATYDDTALTNRVKANEDKLAVVQGADTVDGSIAKALKDAEAYTDGQVATEKAAREAGDSALDTRVKALEAIDHSVYALDADLDGVSGKVSDIETSLATGGATAQAIAAAKKAGDDAQADVNDLSATVTSNMNKTVTFEGGFLKAGADTIIFNCGSATVLVD